jgi:hypothetical protein
LAPSIVYLVEELSEHLLDFFLRSPGMFPVPPPSEQVGGLGFRGVPRSSWTA